MDVGRRRLLVALAGLPLLGVVPAACSADVTPKAAPGGRDDIDADVKVRWRAVRSEHALLALHAAVVAAHPSLAGTLAPMTAHHDEHLAALEADGSLPFGAPAPPQGPDVPGSPDAALAALAEAEAQASEARIGDCVAATGPRLAAVLASVAACEDGHRIVLGAR